MVDPAVRIIVARCQDVELRPGRRSERDTPTASLNTVELAQVERFDASVVGPPDRRPIRGDGDDAFVTMGANPRDSVEIGTDPTGERARRTRCLDTAGVKDVLYRPDLDRFRIYRPAIATATTWTTPMSSDGYMERRIGAAFTTQIFATTPLTMKDR
jgi:hypothetical protein